MNFVYPANYYINPVSQIAKFFKSKNALTSGNAINLSPLEIVEMGLNPAYPFEKIYTFVKKTPDSKYWLDETGFAQYFQLQTQKVSRFFYVLLAIVILSIFSPFILSLFGLL